MLELLTAPTLVVEKVAACESQVFAATLKLPSESVRFTSLSTAFNPYTVSVI